MSTTLSTAPLRCWDHDDCREDADLALACGVARGPAYSPWLTQAAVHGVSRDGDGGGGGELFHSDDEPHGDGVSAYHVQAWWFLRDRQHGHLRAILHRDQGDGSGTGACCGHGGDLEEVPSLGSGEMALRDTALADLGAGR